MNRRPRIALLAAAALAACTATAQPVKVDPAIKPYATAPGVSGNLSSIGSDTLNNVMTLWAETFNRLYPNVKIQIEGKGSSTAPPALISGTAQLGPMSREMKGSEVDEFEKKFGYKPTKIRVAVDTLAVFVNKDNAIAANKVVAAMGIERAASPRLRRGLFDEEELLALLRQADDRMYLQKAATRPRQTS